MAKKKKGELDLTRALETLEIVYVPANSVHPNAYNPNRQSDQEFEMLVLSILTNGVTQPIIVHQKTSEIVDGEHRWTAMIVAHYLKKNGLYKKESDGSYTVNIQELLIARNNRLSVLDPELNIPVVFVDMTEVQRRLATLQHNKARGSHDIELEAQLMRDIEILGGKDLVLENLGMSEDEYNRIIEDVPAPDALASEEYSQAWEPTKNYQETAVATGSTKEQVIPAETHGGTAVTAMTAQAIERQREVQKQVAAAKTDEEKKMAQQQSKLYRLTLTFAGEEGDVINEILGEEKAVTLLRLCREEKVRISAEQ